MKIKALYSLWLQPASDMYVGYNTLKDMQVGLSTSVLMASKFYRPYLVTDPEGYKIIEPLKLPWEQIIIIDFAQHDIPTELWNYSKLYALSIVKAPVIHIDHDVFLHNALPDFEELFFQNKETHLYQITGAKKNFGGYYDATNFLKSYPNLPTPPEYCKFELDTAYNCGVMGFMNEHVKQKWVEPLLEWVRNKEVKDIIINYTDDYFFPTTIEQLTIWEAAQYYGWKVDFVNNNGEDICEAAIKTGYTHLLSETKRKKFTMDTLYAFYKKNFKEHSKILITD